MNDDVSRPSTDATQEIRGNPDGTEGHRYGNEADTYDARSPAKVRVGAQDGGTEIRPIDATSAPGENIPYDNGRRAHIDQRTGEARGSGADDGFDSDAQSGDG